MKPTSALPLGPASLDPSPHELPVAGMSAQLGFPSPAEDFLDDGIDLHRWLVARPSATYLYRACGHSMVDAGILDGDLLVVDRSVQPQSGDIVIATWDGQQPSCKFYLPSTEHVCLRAADQHTPDICLRDIEIEVFAVVGIARRMRRNHVRTG